MFFFYVFTYFFVDALGLIHWIFGSVRTISSTDYFGIGCKLIERS